MHVIVGSISYVTKQESHRITRPILYLILVRHHLVPFLSWTIKLNRVSDRLWFISNKSTCIPLCYHAHHVIILWSKQNNQPLWHPLAGESLHKHIWVHTYFVYCDRLFQRLLSSTSASSYRDVGEDNKRYGKFKCGSLLSCPSMLLEYRDLAKWSCPLFKTIFGRELCGHKTRLSCLGVREEVNASWIMYSL